MINAVAVRPAHALVCLHCRQEATKGIAYVCRACRDVFLRGECNRLAWARAVRRHLEELGIRLGCSGRQKSKSITLTLFAQEIGTTPQTLRRRLARAEKVERELADHPELLDLVELGDMDAGAALRRARSEEIAAMCTITPEHIEAAKATVDIRCCDFHDLLASLRNVDLILCDRPYERTWLPNFANLARLANDALAAHGMLAAMVGDAYLPEIFEAMRGGPLPFRLLMHYLYPQKAPTAKHIPHRFLSHAKSVLVYGNLRGRYIMDNVINAGLPDKRWHPHGQDVGGFRELVRRLSLPGQLVVDPCVGGGTVAVASLMEGRRFIGGDVDAKAVQMTRYRLSLPDYGEEDIDEPEEERAVS